MVRRSWWPRWPDVRPSPWLPVGPDRCQYALIEDLLPEPSTEDRREKHPRREIVNAILYVVRSGCPWWYLPADLPPWQTVYWHFVRWEDAGVTEKLPATLRIKAKVGPA